MPTYIQVIYHHIRLMQGYRPEDQVNPLNILYNSIIAHIVFAARGTVYDVESDGESHGSTGNSEASTPVLDRRKASAGSDESGGSGSTGSSNFFRGVRRRRNMLSAFDLSAMKRDLNDVPSADELGSFVK